MGIALHTAQSTIDTVDEARQELRKGNLSEARRITMAAHDNGEDCAHIRNVLDLMEDGNNAVYRHLPGHSAKIWPVAQHGELFLDAALCEIRRGRIDSAKTMLCQAADYFTASEHIVGQQAVRFARIPLLITEGKRAEAITLQLEMTETWQDADDDNARAWRYAIRRQADALRRKHRLPRWVRWVVRR